MDKELERVRAEAAGIELDEELAARFPVKSRQKLEIPGDEADITVYLYEPENRDGRDAPHHQPARRRLREELPGP